MQTFLPYYDFKRSAACLDYRRLGKQRVEAYQIINILKGKQKSNAWKNHPAVLMWKNDIEILKVYYNVILNEWIQRGFNNSMKFLPCKRYKCKQFHPKLYQSHRSNLLRKDYNFYSKFGWKENDNLPYYWPTKEKNYEL